MDDPSIFKINEACSNIRRALDRWYAGYHVQIADYKVLADARAAVMYLEKISKEDYPHRDQAGDDIC